MENHSEKIKDHIKKKYPDVKTFLVPVKEEEEKPVKTRRILKKNRKGKMRNNPCPCKSGKKFKKCCWDKYRTTLTYEVKK